MDLKETLQFYRKQQGLSQIELAEALDVSRQTVSKWETGTALPAAEHLLALSKLYCIPVDCLLNGQTWEAVPLLTELPPVPPAEPERSPLSRRQFFGRMLGAVLLLDLVIFLLGFYLDNLAGIDGLLCPVLRILGCCSIGLVFAWLNRDRPVNRRASLILGLAALTAAIYVFLIPIPLLWRLYDLAAWGGVYTDTGLPTNPILFFAAWSLFDQYALSSHICLIAAYQLGRLWFSKPAKSTPRAQTLSQA